jgi:hypothetical protein
VPARGDPDILIRRGTISGWKDLTFGSTPQLLRGFQSAVSDLFRIT